MKEAFLAALLTVGPGADKEIELMEIVTPVNDGTAEIASTKKYVLAIVPADTKADTAPHIVRHINTKL